MDFNPYTQIKTIVVHDDGSSHEEIVSAPAGYSPVFNRQDSHDAQWELVRADRAVRLSACDWVVARAAEAGEPVAPEWRAYRQALRDVTSQSNPFLIEWPVAPVPTASPKRLYRTAPEIAAGTIQPMEI